MKNQAFFLLIITAFALSFLPACEKAPVIDEAAVRSSIDSVNQAFMAALKAKDAAALAALYTSDAQLLPPNSPAVNRAGIEGYWQAGLASMGGLELKTSEVKAYPGGAVEFGTAKVFAPDGTQIDEGKYIVVWKQENGAWRLYRDIWNSDVPMPAPAAPVDSLSVNQ